MGLLSSGAATKVSAAAPSRAASGPAFLPIGRLVGKDVLDPDATFDIREAANALQLGEEAYVPLSTAKESIDQLDRYAARFKTARLDDLDEIQLRLETMQEELKARYAAFYGKYVSDIRATARRRLEQQSHRARAEAVVAKARSTADVALLTAKAAVESARIMSENARRQWNLIETAIDSEAAAVAAASATRIEADATQSQWVSAQKEALEELEATKGKQASLLEVARKEHELAMAAANEQSLAALAVEKQRADELRKEAAEASFVAAAAAATAVERSAARSECAIRSECMAALAITLSRIEASEVEGQSETNRIEMTRLRDMIEAQRSDLEAVAERSKRNMDVIAAQRAIDAAVAQLDHCQLENRCSFLDSETALAVVALATERSHRLASAESRAVSETQISPLPAQDTIENQSPHQSPAAPVPAAVDESSDGALLQEERRLRRAAEDEAAALAKSNSSLLENNAKLEASLLERVELGETNGSGSSSDETIGRLRTQLKDSIQGNQILRDELLALNRNLDAVNATVDDQISERSNAELQRMTNYARLQSRQAHEELKKAHSMIKKLKKQVARAKAAESSTPRETENTFQQQSAADDDDAEDIGHVDEQNTDKAALKEEIASQRTKIAKLEAKFKVLTEGREHEQAHAVKATAHAEVVERRAEVVAEVAAARHAQAEALERCAAIAAELAEARAQKNEAEKCAQGYVESVVEAAMKADTEAIVREEALEAMKTVGRALKDAVAQGTSLWRAGKRAECCAEYKTTARNVLSALPKTTMDDPLPGWMLGETNLAQEIATLLRSALEQSESQPAARGAVAIRKSFDKVLDRLKEKISLPKSPVDGPRFDAAQTTTPPTLQTPRTAAQQEAERLYKQLQEAQDECTRMASEVAKANDALYRVEQENADSEAEYATTIEHDRQRALKAEERAAELEAEVDELQAQLSEIQVAPAVVNQEVTAQPQEGGSTPATTSINASALQLKLRTTQKELRAEQAKVRALEEQISSGENSKGAIRHPLPKSHGSSGGDGSDSRAIKMAEKKHAKQMEEASKKAERAAKQAEAAAKKATKEIEQLQFELKDVKGERDALKKKVASLESESAQLESLRERAEEAARLEAQCKEMTKEAADLEKKYKEELALRKKYWNMMEDMKGKIRVFARCRPMAKYEIQKGCRQAVSFVDETTMTVEAAHGLKEFNFDNIFPPVTGGDAGQSAIFEDTSNLIQSCLDGFNVCIFAYGQTGSGKTFTMTGVRDNPELRGITPRAIHAIFDHAKEMEVNSTVQVSSYFLELYNDNLVDLYERLDNPTGNSAPKLDIKLDNKKMVFVKGAIIKPVTSADELLNLFEAGNAKRHVGATKMNAESSRSHSVFAVILEVYNKTTKKTSVGKLSLVDLAGSERADKTGATAERLKEAQNINKSLSALGDVIAALSNNEKFIPYRNNKLTMLMQDSLGGNAKTLMFVNISPADYNSDETITSLTYASRVKLIKNNANKNADSEEVAQLKAIIKDLKNGGTGEVAGVDLMV